MDLVQSSGKVEQFKEQVANIVKEGGKPNLTDYFPALKMIDLHGTSNRSAINARRCWRSSMT